MNTGDRDAPEQSDATLESLIGGAQTLVFDLLAQTLNLIVSVECELKAIEEDKGAPLEGGWRGSPISVRALKSSIVLLQFATLEELANFTAELTVRSHKGLYGAPALLSPLSQVELDFLREERSFVNADTGKVKIQHGAYISTLNKLSVAPLLFAKSHGKSFRLNKGNSGWENVRKLKALRDALTHIRFGTATSTTESDMAANSDKLDLDTVRPSILINGAHLFAGSESISWYCRELMRAFVEVGAHEYESIMRLLKLAEFTAYMHLINLQPRSSVSERRLQRLLPCGVIAKSAHTRLAQRGTPMIDRT
jgi:hypothetical protein